MSDPEETPSGRAAAPAESAPAGEPDWLQTGRLAELGLLSAELIHELRQPLFAVRALLQLHAASEKGAGDALKPALEQLAHMERLLSAWGGSARPTGSGVEPVVPLAPPIRAAALVVRPRLRRLRRTLDISLHDASGRVSGDPVAIQQITTNLLANAADASRARVRLRLNGQRLEVEDDGRGLEPEVQARMFDPYYTTKGSEQGTGLGLAITRHLVRGVGAELSWDTSAGGTVFRVDFPEPALS